MGRPDFAVTDLSQLGDRDLKFIIENFPEQGNSYEEIAQSLTDFPTTLESLLRSEYMYRHVCDQSRLLLNVSPFLLFNVLLRHALPDHRDAASRRLINYLANMLALFVRAERVYRIHPGDEQTHAYMVELIEEAQSADPKRRFLTYSHIGNYALFLTGMFPQWIEHRRRYKRRPVSERYYVDLGSAYFQQAAQHLMAREFKLDDVFLRLSMLFDYYRNSLNTLRQRFLHLN